MIAQTPVGSLPRSPELQRAYANFSQGEISREQLDSLIEKEIQDVAEAYSAIEDNPIITTGEVEKPNFITYYLENGFIALGAPDAQSAVGAFTIDFEGHHSRELHQLSQNETPFRYAHYADEWLPVLKRFTDKPFKAAVIAPSAVSLIYSKEISGYSKEEFLEDAVNECVKDVRKCIAAGAAEIGMDMTEATYALKVDSSGGVLRDMVSLINRVCDALSAEELDMITLHTCFGADNFTNHNYSNYQDVYPTLLGSKIRNFHLPYASLGERNFDGVLKLIKENIGDKKVYLGFVSHLARDVETAERIAERIVHAAEVLGAPPGVSECCGYSPFCNDRTTTRAWAFEKIKARVEGARLASQQLGL